MQIIDIIFVPMLHNMELQVAEKKRNYRFISKIRLFNALLLGIHLNGHF